MASSIKISIIGGVVVLLWLWGFLVGRAMVQGKWDLQKGKDAEAVTQELARQIKERQAYDAQIVSANVARDQALAELHRIASAPHPKLVCHTAPSSGGVPKVPAATSAQPAGVGELPKEFSYDPWPEAQRADALVEACRDFYNHWPAG